jgi:phosphohistidine phosphatase
VRTLVPDIDAVLASRLVRAWQTAELLHEEARWPEPQVCEALEPGHSLAAVVEELRRHEGSIALVAHEPTCSRLTSLLCTGSDGALHVDVKKGAVVLVELDEPEPGRGLLRWVLPPKALRALGG